MLEKALHKVQDSVRSGRSIAGPLGEHPVFPTMVVQMIAVGEDSGSLEQMLTKIADFYDDEVQTTTEALTSLIEPLMIAVIGVLIGGIIVVALPADVLDLRPDQRRRLDRLAPELGARFRRFPPLRGITARTHHN